MAIFTCLRFLLIFELRALEQIEFKTCIFWQWYMIWGYQDQFGGKKFFKKRKKLCVMFLKYKQQKCVIPINFVFSVLPI